MQFVIAVHWCQWISPTGTELLYWQGTTHALYMHRTTLVISHVDLDRVVADFDSQTAGEHFLWFPLVTSVTMHCHLH